MKLGGIGARGQAAQSSEMGKRDVKRADGGATGKVPARLKRARKESAKTNDGSLKCQDDICNRCSHSPEAWPVVDS